MTNQMASRFRVKKLSPKHPLPVFKEKQLPDLDEANLQRAVPQIETGVEKDEEEEHDLQAAISAARAAVTTGQDVARYIPTPDASRQIDDKEYSRVYNVQYKQPNSLIRYSMTVDELISCRYVMDEEDVSFLEQHNMKKKDHKLSDDAFEHMMDLMESGVSSQMPHLNLDPSQTPDYAELLKMIPDLARTYNSIDIEPVAAHWRARRIAAGGKPIIPELMFEDFTKGDIDPYVCFRRRETKSVRKTRRTDQQSLERLRKLRTEMEKARNLLEMVLRREKIRKEGLVQEHAVFDKRCEIREYQRQLGIRDEEALMPVPKKKRKIPPSDTGSSTTIKIPLNRRKRDDANTGKSPMQLAIESELARKREEDADYEDVTNCSYQPFPLPLPLHFFQSLVPEEKTQAPRFRKRIGRGGRVLIDRIGYRTPDNVDDRYRFDPDVVCLDEEIEEVDENDDRFVPYHTSLSNAQLAVLDKNVPAAMSEVPNMLKNDAMGRGMVPNNGGGMTAPAAASSTATPTVPIKRQNSRSRMTPREAAIAMTNGMIATHLSAAMNGVSVQMTRTGNNSSTTPLQQPTPPPHKSSASPSPQLTTLQTYTARIS